jgi:acyl dehydratase
MSYGRYFEEFQPGDIYKHWPGRTITEHDNAWFALLSMNQNPMFLDHHHAPQRPVVDTLIFSLAVGQSVADTSGKTIANLGYERAVFEKPLFVGDSLESEVLETRESGSKPDRGIVYIETRAFNQRGERVLVLRRRFLAPKKGKKGTDDNFADFAK